MEFISWFVMPLRMSIMFVGTRPRDTMSMAFWRIVRLLVCGIEARTERPSSIVETGLILPVAMSDILDSS